MRGPPQIAFDETRLTPEAKQVYVGDRGHLTDKDLTDFDLAVDRFINADYYRYFRSSKVRARLCCSRQNGA